MIEEKAVLALADGTIFRGKSIGASGRVNGEIVFNTSMTGYQEILTDPSYSKQIVTLTYPHIGNTGTNQEFCVFSVINLSRQKGVSKACFLKLPKTRKNN